MGRLRPTRGHPGGGRSGGAGGCCTQALQLPGLGSRSPTPPTRRLVLQLFASSLRRVPGQGLGHSQVCRATWCAESWDPTPGGQRRPVARLSDKQPLRRARVPLCPSRTLRSPSTPLPHPPGKPGWGGCRLRGCPLLSPSLQPRAPPTAHPHHPEAPSLLSSPLSLSGAFPSLGSEPSPHLLFQAAGGRAPPRPRGSPLRSLGDAEAPAQEQQTRQEPLAWASGVSPPSVLPGEAPMPANWSWKDLHVFPLPRWLCSEDTHPPRGERTGAG